MYTIAYIDLRRVMSYYLFNESKQTRIEISHKITIFQSDSEEYTLKKTFVIK